MAELNLGDIRAGTGRNAGGRQRSTTAISKRTSAAFGAGENGGRNDGRMREQDEGLRWWWSEKS
jgi:hypothetical protein